jgi:hypothetical protein
LRIVHGCIGVALIVVTAWLVVPVLAPERPPPARTGLFVGVIRPNAAGGPDGVLYLKITASHCSNPATIEGEFVRAGQAWLSDEHAHGRATGAVVVLAGAPVDSTEIVADQGYPQEEVIRKRPNPGIVSEEAIANSAQAERKLRRRWARESHQVQSDIPRIEGRGNGAWLAAPTWYKQRSALSFTLRADLVTNTGYNRCYVSVPELLKTELTQYLTPLYTASLIPGLEGNNHVPPGSGAMDEVGAAVVTVVGGPDIVSESSLPPGGTASSGNAVIECAASSRPIPRDLEAGEATEGLGATSVHTCPAAPVFEAAGVGADVTRRLFAGGILGALGLTWLVEAVFGGVLEPLSRRETA